MKAFLLIIQRLCIGLGVALLTIWGAGQLHRELGQRQDLKAFEAARQAVMAQRRQLALEEPSPDPAGRPAATEQGAEIPTLPVAAAAGPSTPGVDLPPPPVPTSLEHDYSLWSPTRVEDYEASLDLDLGAPQALLRIPAIDLEVPVLDGIDELKLNRAVGRIPGTARPDGLGNIGIAGHRDGFFRGLKDIEVGDDIELLTWRQRMRYEVKEIRIVEKDDIGVLTASDESMVTLVTCYPFYYVGHAPRRYIVKASLKDSDII